MNTRDSSPELSIKLGPGLNRLSLWLLIPSIKLLEDVDYDTREQGYTRFDFQAPSRILWSGNENGWFPLDYWVLDLQFHV